MAVDYEKVYKVAALLLECACAKLRLTEAGCPDRRCVVPGLEPEAANCCPSGGQLTVNLIRVFPSEQFPFPLVAANNCDAPYDVATFAVTVFRCMPTGSTQHAPSCDALDKAAFTTMVDLMAVQDGVICCMKDKDRMHSVIGEPFRWALGDHGPTEATGGCVGTALIVQVGIPRCWEC